MSEFDVQERMNTMGSGGMLPWENFAKIGFKWLIFRQFLWSEYSLKKITTNTSPQHFIQQYRTGDAHP